MESDSVLGQIVACANHRFFCWGLSWWSFPNAVAYMSFPGKVIENLWLVSLSCLRTQVLVRVPNFFWLYFWKMRSKAAIRARTCAGSSHWVASPTLWPLSYHSSFDINVFLVESDSILGQFFACANLRFFGWGLSCWPFPNAVAYMSFPGKVFENLWFVSLSCLRTLSVGSFSHILVNIFLKMRSKAAGRARSCAGCSHWISSPTS